MSDEAVAERAVQDLARDGLVRRQDVCARAVHREDYGYVVCDHGHAERVRRVRDYVDSLGIHAAGRFAEVRYANMDGCLRRAMELAELLDAGGAA